MRQKDRHFVFEDPKPTSGDPIASTISAQEWLDVIDQAKEFATSQAVNNNTTYSADDVFNISTSALSSQSSNLDQPTNLSPNSMTHTGRATLHKQHSGGGDGESLKGRKRFSKRQSKSGLTAVF
jgi:3-phosphoinositide dependent protein kinase-1